MRANVDFALEVHPTEIAFDIVTARRALKAVKNRKAFGFNFDPSHLHWQMIDPVAFLKAFQDRIYHVHMKDAQVRLDGRIGHDTLRRVVTGSGRKPKVPGDEIREPAFGMPAVSVLETFNRYNYNVVSSHLNEEDLDEFYQERFDSFLKYLNT